MCLRERRLFEVCSLSTNSLHPQTFRSLVHEIGAMLDTLARPTRLLRSSVGPFRREHALLEKYFQLPSIIQNIQMCNRIIDDHLKDGRTELVS